VKVLITHNGEGPQEWDLTPEFIDRLNNFADLYDLDLIIEEEEVEHENFNLHPR
jgi:hypothetical protein